MRAEISCFRASTFSRSENVGLASTDCTNSAYPTMTGSHPLISVPAGPQYLYQRSQVCVLLTYRVVPYHTMIYASDASPPVQVIHLIHRTSSQQGAWHIASWFGLAWLFMCHTSNDAVARTSLCCDCYMLAIVGVYVFAIGPSGDRAYYIAVLSRVESHIIQFQLPGQ